MAKPKLRFPEFTDDVSSIKLHDLFEKITKKNKDMTVTNVITNSAKGGLMPQADYFLKDIANQDNIDGYYVIQKGDFVYNPRKSSEAPFGPFNVYNLEDDGVVSPLYLCLHPKQMLNKDYMLYYFKGSSWHKYIYMNGDTGARHDRVSIKDETLLQMPVMYPSSEEQIKIADFLFKIDEMISTQELIVSNLEDQKKGMMQKIFNQEIRFKADDGSDFPQWTEEKFSDIFEFQQSNTFSRAEMTQNNESDVLNIHYGDILVKFECVVDCQKVNLPYLCNSISTKKFKEESFLKDGDIIIADTAEDMTVGKAIEVTNIGDLKILSGLHTMMCRPKRKFANMYLGYFMNSTKFHNQLLRLVSGAKVSAISKSNIINVNIYFPCVEEQEIISNFMLAFDKQIENERAILDNWRDQKKALLQQMFV